MAQTLLSSRSVARLVDQPYVTVYTWLRGAVRCGSGAQYLRGNLPIISLDMTCHEKGVGYVATA